jgi:hypothetical protein
LCDCPLLRGGLRGDRAKSVSVGSGLTNLIPTLERREISVARHCNSARGPDSGNTLDNHALNFSVQNSSFSRGLTSARFLCHRDQSSSMNSLIVRLASRTMARKSGPLRVRPA